MEAQHTAEHESLLEEFVVDPTGPEADELRRSLMTCPHCRLEVERFEDLLADLDDAGFFERGVLRESRTVTESWLGKRLGVDVPGDPEPGSGWRRTAVLFAAAAAVLLVLRLSGVGVPESAGAPVFLGAETNAEMTPSGEVDTYGALFRWNLELPTEGYYVVNVYDVTAATGDEFTPLATSPRVRISQCTWSSSEVAGWPDRIRWEVWAFDAGGNLVGSVEAQVSLSSS